MIRYGVKTRCVKRVTARNPFQRQPAPARQAKTVNGFDRILRAGRLKTACRRQGGGHKALIKTDGNQGNVFHESNLARLRTSDTACCISVKGASVMLPRAINTKSYPAGISRKRGRRASRRRRFARLRNTAMPSFFPAIKPARETASPLGRTRNMTSGWANARPCCHTRCTSDSAFSRHARFTQVGKG